MAIQPGIKAGLESFIFELTQTHFATNDRQLAIFISHKDAALSKETKTDPPEMMKNGGVRSSTRYLGDFVRVFAAGFPYCRAINA
jgi:hypothetical protein